MPSLTWLSPQCGRTLAQTWTVSPRRNPTHSCAAPVTLALACFEVCFLAHAPVRWGLLPENMPGLALFFIAYYLFTPQLFIVCLGGGARPVALAGSGAGWAAPSLCGLCHPGQE